MRRTIIAIAVASAVAVGLAAPASAGNTVTGGGASFPYPFISTCAANFNASQNNFSIQYQSTGSGTGKSSFTKGVFAFGQTDSKYSSGEPTFGWQYIPNIGGAIAFPINLHNTKTGKTLGSSINLKRVTLSKILSGNIKKWNDPEILKDNSFIASNIPNIPITVVYRSGNSGTTNNTLQYLNSWTPTIWTKVQDDFATAFPGGNPLASSLSAKDNASLMSAVNSKEGAIGYVDFSDAKGYPVARIENASGQFVPPSAATAAKNLANQINVSSNGLVSLDYNSKITGVYPVVIFSYMLVRTDGKGPNGLGIRQFADYVLQKCGPSNAASLGYVPVAGKVLATAKTLVNKIK
jgi:phosphate transport system substrate-binding protein